MSIVQRQITLPTSKAVEIAYKSIRLRLGRSLLVTSGIVLALAFWVSIRTADLVERGLREYVSRSREPAAQALASEMQARGVMSSDAGSALRTRWLLAIALLVAFVGILNAMLMSVTERFREIGTMKCLGALDTFIVKMFLLESLFQGLVGTALGILIGLVASFVAAATNYGLLSIQHAPWTAIMASIVISVILGIGLTVAGAVYPAWQAARMQPIDAMRVEA